MNVNAHGKYTRTNRRIPAAIATCDYSGMIVQHSDLVMQRDYNAKGLYDKNLWVHPKFADRPNPQFLTPRIKIDPAPLKNARPDRYVGSQTTLATTVGVLNLDVGGNTDVTMSNDDYVNNGSFNFTGELTGNVVIYVPAIAKQFYANNMTTGAFTLGMQIIANSMPPVLIPLASPSTQLGPVVSNSAFTLQLTLTS